jgi:hypothetical protein
MYFLLFCLEQVPGTLYQAILEKHQVSGTFALVLNTSVTVY